MTHLLPLLSIGFRQPPYGTQQRQVLVHASTPKKEWDASHRLKHEPFSLAYHEEELMCQILSRISDPAGGMVPPRNRAGNLIHGPQVRVTATVRLG